MLKRILFCGAIVAAAASVAFGAATLTSIGVYSSSATNPYSYGSSISTDGKYIAGESRWNDPANPTWTETYGYNTTTSTGFDLNSSKRPCIGTGIDSAGSNYYWVQRKTSDNTGAWGKNGGSVSSLRALDGTTSVAIGSNNAIAVTPDGSNAFAVGGSLPGTTGTYANYGYIWMYNWSSANSNKVWNPVTPISGKLTLNSVASNGRVIGNDQSGTGGGDLPVTTIYKTVQGNTCTSKAVPYLPSPYDSNKKGMGRGISADGNWLTGYMYSGGTRPVGFRYQWLDANSDGVPEGNSSPLWPVGYTDTNSLASLQADSLDIAPDGAAVGWTYDASGFAGGNTTDAAIWLPGQDTATSLRAWMAAMGVNVGDWTYLRQASSITKIGNEYAITGYGLNSVSGLTEGFYFLTPEPATALFLAFGLLPLLRRRR